MSRAIFAIFALFGQTIWLITPKLASASNPFSALIRYSIIWLPLFLILSKVFYGVRLSTSDRKIWWLYILWGAVSTIAYILAVKYGGTIPGIVSIMQLAIVWATLISFFFFHEKINTMQIMGIILLCIGSIMVLGFAQK
jgi:uncharacterized membrane protein